MPLLQVRDFPEELYGNLKIAAKAANRSISQHTVVVIREHLQGQQTVAPTYNTTTESNKQRRSEALAAIERFHLENPGIFDGAPDPVDLIREDRDHDRFDSMELV